MSTQPVSLSVPIVRSAPERREVYGFLSVARTADGEVVTDSHGSQIPVEELERAAHAYLVEARGVGEMHERMGVGVVIESCVLTREKQAALPPRGIPEGHVHEGWFVGFRVDDPETWEKVKRGELRAFSIGGTARRGPVALRKSAAAGEPQVHQLVDLVLDEGSLVDEPANPLCTVVLFKRREEKSMFKRLRDALASIIRKQEDAPPPSTADVVATQEMVSTWWRLRDAYESAMMQLLNSEQPAADLVAGMLRNTREFADAFEQMAGKLPGAVQKAANVESLEAALLAFVESCAAGNDMATAAKDLKATLDQNAPGPRPEEAKKEEPAPAKEEKPAEEPPAAEKPEAPAPPAPAMEDEVKKRLAAAESEREALVKKAEAAEREAEDLRKKLDDESVRRDAGGFPGVPGLTLAEVEQVLRAIRGTDADALVRKSFTASVALVRRLSEPAAPPPPNDETPTDVWERAVTDVMRARGVSRTDAVRIAMQSHKHAFEQSARASIRPQ